MGFTREIYSNNRVNLFYINNPDQENDEFYVNTDSAQEAIKYFGLYTGEDNFLYAKTKTE